MDQQNYTTTFVVDKSPEQVFNAINNVRAWWSGEIDGVTDKVGEEFTYKYKDLHRSVQKITELVPGKKVVWHVTDSNLDFVSNKTEWTGSDIVFNISEVKDGTELKFTHIGLMPENECYNSCSNAWGMLVNGNLRNLILTGQSQPNPFES